MRVVLSFLALCLLTGPAHADSTPLVSAGDRVLAQESYWNECGTQIYTDLVVEKSDGSIETTRMLGGVVGDLAMIHHHVTVGKSLHYVRTRTDDGIALHWPDSRVSIVPDIDGTADIADDGEEQILADVLVHWRESTESCGELDLELASPDSVEVGFDERNVVKFREEEWCRPTDYCNEDPECYSPRAIAITSLCFRLSDGAILDADIEVNAVDFALAVDGNTLGEGVNVDLRATLTHEVGHLIGLDHTCWDGQNPPQRPMDHRGEPVPNCSPESQLPPEIVNATMYPHQRPGDDSMATLELDDIDGFCAIYPPSSGGGCRVGGENGSPLLLLAFTLVVAARRRPRRRV